MKAVRVPEAHRKLAGKARKAGWTIEHLQRHLLWTSPSGERIITPATPGCKRGILNARSKLKKAGLS
jgi:hypothetical protein